MRTGLPVPSQFLRGCRECSLERHNQVVVEFSSFSCSESEEVSVAELLFFFFFLKSIYIPEYRPEVKPGLNKLTNYLCVTPLSRSPAPARPALNPKY